MISSLFLSFFFETEIRPADAPGEVADGLTVDVIHRCGGRFVKLDIAISHLLERVLGERTQLGRARRSRQGATTRARRSGRAGLERSHRGSLGRRLVARGRGRVVGRLVVEHYEAAKGTINGGLNMRVREPDLLPVPQRLLGSRRSMASACLELFLAFSGSRFLSFLRSENGFLLASHPDDVARVVGGGGASVEAPPLCEEEDDGESECERRGRAGGGTARELLLGVG